MFVRIRELFAGVLNKQQVSQNNVEFFERNISFAIAHTVLKNKKIIINGIVNLKASYISSNYMVITNY